MTSFKKTSFILDVSVKINNIVVKKKRRGGGIIEKLFYFVVCERNDRFTKLHICCKDFYYGLVGIGISNLGQLLYLVLIGPSFIHILNYLCKSTESHTCKPYVK